MFDLMLHDSISNSFAELFETLFNIYFETIIQDFDC